MSTAPKRARQASAGSRSGAVIGRTAGLVQSLASLIWIPQAGLLALAIGRIAAGDNEIAWLALGVLLLGVARAALDAAGTRVAFREARALLARERTRAAEALGLSSPLAGGRAASGEAASALAEQAEALLPYLSRFRPARFRATLVPLAMFVAVLPFSWLAALALLIAAPMILLFMALIGLRAKAASEAQLVELGGLNAFLLDRLRGLATIRTLGAVDETARRLRGDAESLRARTMAVLRIAFLSSAVLELFAALGVAMVAGYVGFHLLGTLEFGTWGGRLSLAEGLFVLLLAPAFFEPLRELSAVWHDRAAGEAACDALDALAARNEAMLGRGAAPVQPARMRPAPALHLRGLSFSHPGRDEAVLDGFDLAVSPGERLALLGPSGSGKSTLLALIAGLAAPSAGTITIGGHRLDAESADGLRTGMVWIGQSPHVFAGSLARNVGLGRPGLGRAEIAAALGQANLAEIASIRGDAPIGEAGLGLSGGEALRLALARAFATPQATLVLADEPTAHLDARTAAGITDALLRLAAGRTLVVATHDPALAARMDRIVRLDMPRLQEAAA